MATPTKIRIAFFDNTSTTQLEYNALNFTITDMNGAVYTNANWTLTSYATYRALDVPYGPVTIKINGSTDWALTHAEFQGLSGVTPKPISVVNGEANISITDPVGESANNLGTQNVIDGENVFVLRIGVTSKEDTITSVTVIPETPTRSGNTITIPTQAGVVYQNKADSTVLTGTAQIATNTTLTVKAVAAAHPTPTTHRYVLSGTTEWPFVYETVITTDTETKTEPIPYTTEYRDTAELKVGESRTVQTGVNGEYTIVETVTYTDGVETNRVETSRTVSVEMVPEIIEQGTHVPVITTEIITVTEEYAPPAAIRTANPDMYEGEERVVKEGIPYIYEIDYEVTYEDGVEVSRQNMGGVLIQDGVAGQIEYGTKPVPASLEVTAPIPLRTGNTIHIPDVLGVEYVDMTGGTEAAPSAEPMMSAMATATNVLTPGDHIITSTAVIIPQAKTGGVTEFILTNPYATWPYAKYEAIIPEAPTEYERYIVIPESDDIEYFDGMTGEVYPGGTERKIGDELIINTRLIKDNAFLTNDAATWTYTRTGGVTALNITMRDAQSRNSFYIPKHSQIEYINKETGEVLKHNSYDGTYYDLNQPGAMPPTGVLTIVPRAIEPAFLTNPYAEWTAGTFRYGLEFVTNVQKLDIETGQTTPVDVGADFADYVEVYINGQLHTAHQSPAVYGEVTMELKLKKDTGFNRLALDWIRGEQGEPTGNYWINFTGTAPEFEWTGEDTLRTTFTWTESNPLARLYIRVQEVDAHTYGKHTLQVSPLVGFNAQGDYQVEPILKSIGIVPTDYSRYFDIQVNGVKLTPTDFINVSKENGTAELDIQPGYKEIRLILTNPDFIWEDFLAVRRTSLWLNGPDGFVVNFEADTNGDLIWTGVWPEGVQSGTLLIYPFMPQIAVFEVLDKVAPYYDEINKIVQIPSHSVIEYYDMSTLETLPPGPFQITRYTEIGDRIKWDRRVEKVNGQYYIYEIQDDHRFWYFNFTIADGVIYVTALPPTQAGTIVTIPQINGILYWDMLAREYVEGDIQLLDRQHKSMRIKPIAQYSTYRLTNPNDVWEYISNFDVYSERPVQVDNTITIPEIKGIEYINKTTGEVLTGSFRITEDIVIQARATGQYILKSLTNEWTFKWVFIEAKRVTAVEPTRSKNWVTIPEVEGVRYLNIGTGTAIQGTVYVKDQLVIGVEPVSERYLITNDVRWTFDPMDTGQKEIILMDRDPRLVIHINGIEVAGDVFAVDPGIVTSIVLSLLEDSEFSVDPYLLDEAGTQTLFTRVADNRGATLEVTFQDTVPIEMHVGEVTQLTKPLYFTGENTYLEIRQSGAYIATLHPGETGRLFIENNYDFTVVPEYGHDFDRPGKFTHNAVTSAIIPNTGKNASFSIPFIQGPIFITMDAVELTEAVSPHQAGYNNVYITEYETLNLISEEMLKKRRSFILNNPDSGLVYDAQIETNPHMYIINTIKVPFSVPYEYVANRERISIGYTELFASALRLREHNINLNLGQIYTEPKYGNSYDFANTSVVLHLPYTQPITIDASYAIGQTIGLEYIVDVFTGYATVNVRSSLVNNNIFYSLEVKIADEVPFISMKDGSVVGGAQEARAKLHNNTPIPYIEVIRNIPYQMDSPFNPLTRTMTGGLTGYQGHIIVHQIHLNLTTATADEESQLRNILAAGIIIK